MATKAPSRSRRSGAGRAARERARRQARRRWTVVGIVFAAFAALAAAGAVLLDTAGGGRADVIAVAPHEAARLINDHRGRPGFAVLDVRTPAEFSTGHLTDAVNVDIDDPGFRHRLTGLAKDDTYVVYCRSGNRSARATALMAELGFTRVHDVRGGIAAWQQVGLPVTT